MISKEELFTNLIAMNELAKKTGEVIRLICLNGWVKQLTSADEINNLLSLSADIKFDFFGERPCIVFYAKKSIIVSTEKAVPSAFYHNWYAVAKVDKLPRYDDAE